MLRSPRSEWLRLANRKTILSAGGAMVGLGVLATLMVFGLAEDDIEPGGPGVPSTILEGPDGFTQSLVFTGQVLGGTSLVVYARNITNEYRNGTLKAMLAREPRRLVFLVGKFSAMTLFVSIALAATFFASLLAALVVGEARGVDTSAWRTATGLAETSLGFTRLLAATIVWGLFGFALGAITRSGGTAIGIGIGVLAIGGHLMEMFWDDAARWLPDLVLAVFTVGGTDEVSLGWAGALVVAYAVALAVAAAIAFAKGDVKA